MWDDIVHVRPGMLACGLPHHCVDSVTKHGYRRLRAAQLACGMHSKTAERMMTIMTTLWLRTPSSLCLGFLALAALLLAIG
jgi:hypothetical protein